MIQKTLEVLERTMERDDPVSDDDLNEMARDYRIPDNGTGYTERETQKIVDMLRITDRNVAFYLDEYYEKEPKMSVIRKVIKKIWFRMIKITTLDTEQWGIGFTGISYNGGSREVHGNVLYYLLNPKETEMVVAEGYGFEAAVANLYQLAIHEAAHEIYYSHDQRHEDYMDKIRVQTYASYHRIENSLIKQLRKAYAKSKMI